MMIAFLIVCTFSLTAQPKIVVSSEKIDLGTIYNGIAKQAEIKLTNAGKDTLKITAVQSSCGCTTVKQPKSELAPGESDMVKVEFNSTGFRGPATKHVYISSNDPGKPMVNVVLNAEIKEELEPSTKSNVLWLGTVQMGKSVTETISFTNVSGRQIKVKGVSAKNPGISVKFEPESLKPSEEVKLTITVTQKTEGYLNEEIFIETDSKNQPRVPLRISLVGVKPS
jgi:hypothetical protein